MTPEQRDKENKAQAKKLLDQLNAEDEKEGCHFGIGKAYGGNKWEERLVKATSSSLTKSMSERLEVLQMLAKIQTANDRATFSTHISFLLWLFPFVRVNLAANDKCPSFGHEKRGASLFVQLLSILCWTLLKEIKTEIWNRSCKSG